MKDYVGCYTVLFIIGGKNREMTVFKCVYIIRAYT
jgi:hypothetical protein